MIRFRQLFPESRVYLPLGDTTSNWEEKRGYNYGSTTKAWTVFGTIIWYSSTIAYFLYVHWRTRGTKPLNLTIPTSQDMTSQNMTSQKISSHCSCHFTLYLSELAKYLIRFFIVNLHNLMWYQLHMPVATRHLYEYVQNSQKASADPVSITMPCAN